ncbi:MAG TPA: LuxR C-terminal-related transcriptional regulator [Ktedonobacterales bacterium]
MGTGGGRDGPRRNWGTLSISLKTVQKHIENLYAKLDVNSGERLVALAWQEGLMERGEMK